MMIQGNSKVLVHLRSLIVGRSTKSFHVFLLKKYLIIAFFVFFCAFPRFLYASTDRVWVECPKEGDLGLLDVSYVSLDGSSGTVMMQSNYEQREGLYAPFGQRLYLKAQCDSTLHSSVSWYTQDNVTMDFTVLWNKGHGLIENNQLFLFGLFFGGVFLWFLVKIMS